MANTHRSTSSGRSGVVAADTRSNPYGLPLAPVRRERPSEPFDLGDFGVPELRGWLVVFSRDVDFAVYRRAREVFQAAKDAQDASDDDEEGEEEESAADDAAAKRMARGMSGLQVMDEVVGWLEEILLGWNFVDGTGSPLPQPREGGAQFCPVSALPAIAKAFGRSSTPPKD